MSTADRSALDDDPIGSVADIVHWGDRLAIADGFGRNVKVFSASGSLVMTLGRAGDGPGEFREPMALGVLGDGRLAVLDRRRVEVSFRCPRRNAPDWNEAPNKQGGMEQLFRWSTNYEWLVAIIPADGFVAVRYHGGDGRQGTGWSRYILLDEEGREQLVTDRTDAKVHLIREGRAYGVSIGDDGEAYLETYQVHSPF